MLRLVEEYFDRKDLSPRAELDARFVLMPMPAEFVKGIAEPVVTYAVGEGPSAAAPSADEAGDR